jgi:hypothetical protein
MSDRYWLWMWARLLAAVTVITWIGLILVTPTLSAQDQPTGSLADIARQARAQKQGQPGDDSGHAQQVADQLSEDQNDAAPEGFKTYNAGDYKLWVPAPYRMEGHDDAGAVLSGPIVGAKTPLVLVGTPIAFHWQTNDAAFHDAAANFSHLYAPSSKCEKNTIENRAAYRCSLANASLSGTRVSGNAVFALGSDNIYPLFCVTTTDGQAHDILSDPHASNSAKQKARKALESEDAESKGVWQQCETVFQSIHLKPQAIHSQSAQADAPAPAEQAPTQASPVPAASTKQVPTSSASGEQAATAPDGFKVHPLHYCSGPQQCWDGSVLVPSDAQLISSECKHDVFETKVQGAKFLLLAGPARGDCDGHAANTPDLVRWKQLADPETNPDPSTYSTIGSQSTRINGTSATITTIAFRNGLENWMGKRAEVESNGVLLVVGCMAPRDHFADGDSVCSTLIGSLQLP